MWNATELLEQLSVIAAEWRASGVDREPEPAQVGRFRAGLDQLYALEWDYVLGEENELPDQYLPERYLKRRATIADELESLLGDLATAYRGAGNGSAHEASAIKRYQRALEELFRIGHWCGEPDLDAQLPDELMPAVYHEAKAARRKAYEEYLKAKQEAPKS